MIDVRALWLNVTSTPVSFLSWPFNNRIIKIQSLFQGESSVTCFQKHSVILSFGNCHKEQTRELIFEYNNIIEFKI